MRSSNIAASSSALLGLLAQISSASTCTSSNAYAVEDYIASGAAGGGGGAGGAGADIFVSYDIFSNAVSNSVKKRNPHILIPASRTPDAKLANIALAVRRATGDESVTCSTSETCLSVQKVPFCLDMVTGAFHDGTGTTGNALTGDYVLGDGRKGNLYNGPHPLPGDAAGAAGGAQTTGTSAAGPRETGAAGSNGDGNGSGNGNGDARPPEQTGSPAPKGSAASGMDTLAVGGMVMGGLVAVVGAELF